MKSVFLACLLMCFLQQNVSEAAIPYFRYTRPVNIAANNRQNYIVVDSALWQHARPNLSDVRLYDGQTRVPYVLKETKSAIANGPRDVKILNLGLRNGRTEFDIDVGELPQYDNVRLRLDKKDFVGAAQTEGRSELGQASGTKLATSTIYDFSGEKLGSSSVLKLPLSSFRYLHIRLSEGIKPQDVKGASVFTQGQEKTRWSNTFACSANSSSHDNILICATDGVTPVSHVVFTVADSTPNFLRNVTVSDSLGNQIGGGEISRLHVTRGGKTVASEDLALDIPETHDKLLNIAVHNGDDAPLPLNSVIVQAVERRIWFEPMGKTSLDLYYGDDKLSKPSYDYASLYREDENAVEANLGSEALNPSFTGRPDNRPWSEQHAYVLWVAMGLTVAVLAGLALRGLASAPKEKN